MDLWKFCDLNESKRYPGGCFWIGFGFRVVCRSCTDKTGHISMNKIAQNDMSFFRAENYHLQHKTTCRLHQFLTAVFEGKRHVILALFSAKRHVVLETQIFQKKKKIHIFQNFSRKFISGFLINLDFFMKIWFFHNFWYFIKIFIYGFNYENFLNFIN